ncbi:serine protease [Kribbella solani]|uniref:S1 family peptidase n=1 Tax=Kribbella solani TaxID=236067 RepID=UPI0029AE1DC9|nr:serine protease [Kribbella solani]MDX3002366.1 serine protease [Kribbella solani]
MVEDGGGGLPRPPRRVPAGAGALTQLEAPARSSGAPPRGPWIFGRLLAGLVVLLIVVAGGAGAGWYVRAQTLRIDTSQVLKNVRPAVVRVLATTCAGTGEGSGVLIDGGRVLTATSAINQPLSIVVISPDGRIHRANLLGTSADGVAVLQPIGQFDGTPVQLAPADPEPTAERALIGYTAAGKATIQSIGSAAEPKALESVLNAAKLGGPVVDKSGRLAGLVVGDTVQTSTIVPLGILRGYAATVPTGISAAAGGSCDRSRGPQSAVAPELQVARTGLATEAQRLLGNYLTLENQHDFASLQSLYSDRLAKTLTEARDRQSHQTSYFFGPNLTEVSADGDGAYARLAYNVLFSPTAAGASGRTCNRLDVRYKLVRADGKLVIDEARQMTDPVACDSR